MTSTTTTSRPTAIITTPTMIMTTYTIIITTMNTTITHHDHAHRHQHDDGHHHLHDHDHSHSHGPGRVISLEQQVLAKNDKVAERVRGWLAGRDTVALNLMSSPGAGKTTLLERTISDLRNEIPLSVVEGDQQTAHDAERILAAGCKVVQINTGAGCHLDASWSPAPWSQLDPPRKSLVMIENVGNLVCPALFDLGELAKVVVVSVTEGDDKPVKYPHMFRASKLMILNKIDLLPYVEFDVEKCVAFAPGQPRNRNHQPLGNPRRSRRRLVCMVAQACQRADDDRPAHLMGSQCA